MAAWFTAYCTESVGQITADDLTFLLWMASTLYTWAELYDIENEEEVVDQRWLISASNQYRNRPGLVLPPLQLR